MTIKGDANPNRIPLDEFDFVLTFDEARTATKNGKLFLSHIFKGRTFKYKARAFRGRATFTFDRFTGNHVLRDTTQELIANEYADYLQKEKLKIRGHTSVTHLVVQLEIKLEHAEYWWSKVWAISCDLSQLERVKFDGPRDPTNNFRFPSGLLRTIATHSDGDLVEVDQDELRKISETLTFNFDRIRSLKPREMEMLVAAIYCSTGYFDRVILTPATRDHGRDVILERDVWKGRRFLIEVKAYSDKRSTPPDKIDGVLGVADGEAPGSCVALFSTSYFSSEIEKRPNVKNTIRKKLQLVDFVGLVEASIQASYSNCPDVLSELRRMTIERQLNES
jgi:HJR/Mrr/RecB family endonuclease